MTGVTSPHSLGVEEKVGLLDDRSLSSSDSDSENGIIDLDQHLSLQKGLRYLVAPLGFFRSLHGRYLMRLAWFLVPSFLQGRHMREQIRPAKVSPTAYLDGMRGLAALFVYFCHYSYQSFTIAVSWGCENHHRQFFKLPIIRLFYQGPAAVCIFFVISGYALSYRPIKLIRSRNTADFSNGMSSMVFRRFLRLFAPTTISTFMIVCLIRMGAYELTREFAYDPKYMRVVREPHPVRMEDAWEQWKDWAWTVYKMIHVFGWEQQGGRSDYDVHLWTIPMEYRCSLYLFLVIIGTARLRTAWRYITLLTVAAVAYRHSRWELLMFFSGMALAEWDHIRGAHVSAPALPIEAKQAKTPRSPLTRAFWGMVSIVGLYLMSFPDDCWGSSPGWVYLYSLIPKWWESEKFRFWQCIGAVVFTLAVSHSVSWQRFFNSGIVQYFGKISYALYLMHGPIMHTVGYHFEKWAWDMTGLEGRWYTAGFFLGAIFCIPSVIWAADIFWRAVDIPTVKFARWFEGKLIVKAD